MHTVSINELPVLLEYLRSFLPRSVHPFHFVLFLIDGRFPPTEDKFKPVCLVDKWPTPGIVWCSFFEPAGEPNTVNVVVFLPDPENYPDVEKFFSSQAKKLDVFNPNRAFLSFSMDEVVTNGILKSFKVNQPQNVAQKVLTMQQWWVPAKDTEEACSLRGIEIPDDLYLSAARLDEAKFVDSVWPHTRPGSYLYWEDRIKHLPNIGKGYFTLDSYPFRKRP